MIKTIVDYHHWPPSEIEKMYCDDYDFKGIVFWYDEVSRIIEMNKPKK